MEENKYLIPLLIRHMNLLNINCDVKQLELVLLSAPSFPSVFSIVQTFNYFGLDAFAYKADYMALSNISMPAIVFIATEKFDRFVMLHQFSETNVIYFDTFENKYFEVTKDFFNEIWTGIIITTEKHENKKGYKSENSYLKYSIYLAIPFLIVYTLATNSLSYLLFFFSGLFILKLSGLWFSIGLVKQEYNSSYSVFDKFCKISSSFSCTDVLKSKASKLFNKISLADIGFIYFTTGIVALYLGLLTGLTIPVLQILFYLAVISCPFIAFSILYQGLVIKKWCLLCLSVMSVLTLEIILFLFFPYKILFNDIISTTEVFLFSLLISTLILFLTKKSLENQVIAFTNSISFLRVKRMPEFITLIFSNQKKIPQHLNDSLIIGKVDAPIVITTLLSTTCTSCVQTANDVILLLENYPSFIKWHLRFDGLQTTENNIINENPVYLYELLRQQENTHIQLKIIKEWYKLKSMRKFSKKYPLKEITEVTNNDFSIHIRNNLILNTDKVPSIWINNRIFPTEYLLDDIRFLLTDIESLQESTI